ncbi:MAG TPA: DUF4149 domain-containing protein [Verrucomicrobiae bacterium]
MISVLRFVGVMNAAAWFGAAILYMCAVAPAFASAEMKRTLGEIYAGVIGQMLVDRFYTLQYWCGSVALAHQLAEWVYLSRPLQRITVAVLAGVFTLSLVNGLWIQPKVNDLHKLRYARAGVISQEQKAAAAKSFQSWHMAASTFNLLGLAGLTVFTWRVIQSTNGTRFSPSGKFRS